MELVIHWNVIRASKKSAFEQNPKWLNNKSF